MPVNELHAILGVQAEHNIRLGLLLEEARTRIAQLEATNEALEARLNEPDPPEAEGAP